MKEKNKKTLSYTLNSQLKIDTEIYAISELLYHSNRNLWEYQIEYLSYKLFDLIHSYLLDIKRNYEIYYEETGIKHNDYDKIVDNLDNCDYSIQSNRDLIPSLQITTKENVVYWYDIPHYKKGVI